MLSEDNSVDVPDWIKKTITKYSEKWARINLSTKLKYIYIKMIYSVFSKLSH